jgi:hypothetical protein
MQSLPPKSNSGSACQHLNIANSKIGEIMICPDCGVVHLSLQSISIRLNLDAFSELAKMVKQAKATLDQAQKFASVQTEPSATSAQVEEQMHEVFMQEKIWHHHPHKVH